MNFKEKYNTNKFIKFLNEFLPDFKLQPEEIKLSKRYKFILSIKKLGGSENLDLNIYEISHSGENDPRISLSKDAFSFLREYYSKNSLVIFTNRSSENYRLSLITFTTSWESGNKVKAQFSNPRRYSFFLGPDAKVHTPTQFLMKKGKILDSNDLLSRFNVEIVTKEFFKQYRKLFEKLVSYLDKDRSFKIFIDQNNVKTSNFAKKLLGQIVFLYFLQRKGWLGAKKSDSIANGDKNFLRNLFNKSREEKLDFFNYYLEPLFYDALNKKTEKAGSFYRDYFECQIPFLNGGLFEPIDNYDWQNQHLNIPNKLFSSNPDSPEDGEGILDVFELYNFTVDEGDSIDKEVSVDPEMLGKVFENLLEENLRKGKGTYYTPREIVHYMCKESLINYLASEINLFSDEIRKQYFPAYNKLGDEEIAVRDVTVSQKVINSLKSIKVIDPACGSGAFLVGMLQQITHLRLELEQRMQLLGKADSVSTEYVIKKETIQNCIYGVDIDQGAVEIAKLRLWLSLVVDYDLEQIEPLPNLDYKIMIGNSLVEKLDSGILNKTTDYDKNKMIDELKTLKDEFFRESDSEKKKILKIRINKLIRELVNYGNKKEKDDIWNQIINYKSQTKIFDDYTQQSFAKAEKNLNEKLERLNKLDEISEIDHFEWHLNFNEVFEKGGFDVAIANPPYINIFNIKDDAMRNYLASHYSVARNKTDLYAFFVEQGNKLLKPQGTLVFIFSNSWLGTDSFSKFRAYLIENTKIKQLIKCPPGVFEEATVTVVIIVLTKGHVERNNIRLLELKDGKFENIPFSLSYDFIKSQISHGFTFNKQLTIKIPTIKLGGIAKFSLGIKTSDDKKFILNSKKDRYCRKMLRGKDVGKWFYSFADKWMWYKPELMSKRKGAGPRNVEYFLKTKILIRDIANEIQATIDDDRYLTTDTVSIIYEIENYDLKFILGLLNSRFINKWFKLNFDAGLHIKINQLQNVPIPANINLGDSKRIIEFVNKILAITKINDYSENSTMKEEVKEYEKQIDQLVYKLYDLTPEEVSVVEEKTTK